MIFPLQRCLAPCLVASEYTTLCACPQAYELLAQGDGKYFQRSNPRFDDVTVAVPYQGPGTSSAPAANPLVPVMAVMTVS